LDRIIGGSTFVMIALTTYHDFPDLISTNAHINPNIRMQEYDSNCISRTNWFDLARTNSSLSKPEPLNAFEGIEGLLNTQIDDLTLPAYFWEQSDVPSPWNTYWAEATAYRGGLELDDPMFGSNWTKYWGAHAWFECDPELPCECEEHNCLGTHSMEGHTPAAAATAKPAPVQLIVIESLAPTPSDVDAYNCHW